MSHLESAQAILDAVDELVAAAALALARRCSRGGRVDSGLLDREQIVAYDLACVSAAAAAARHLVADCPTDEADGDEAALALSFAADVAADVNQRLVGRADAWGVEPGWFDEVTAHIDRGRDPALIEAVADAVVATGEVIQRRLPDDLDMVRQTFRRFTEEKVVPHADAVHRDDADVPEELITGLAELGGFALSVPSGYGGLSEGGDDELTNMLMVTEELARGSLAIAGSLITRPEIMCAAILEGGTEEQKHTWLPKLASGEKMCAIAVTEPDAGSDVAAITFSAAREGDDWVLDGVKTWCTFAGRAEYLLVLVRTDPDRSLGHRGLSLFVVDKPAFAGHEWRIEQDGGGVIEARAIPTIGYRGMHSFEVSFQRWRVAHDALIGGDDGLGRGFYLQMGAFANGRLQTAARAQGLMAAALDAAVHYTRERNVFSAPLAELPLTKAKLTRMAGRLAASRAFATAAARQLARREAAGQLSASQAKQFACLAAEWVTREAQQLHGGYGYAEEYLVSRLFVDARVLSIFEGADEVLALKVIARTLVTEALDS